MKLFFDTEFTGLHQDTTLISIGCIADDGRTFYGEFTDFSLPQCDQWIIDNVISNLEFVSVRDNEIHGYTHKIFDVDHVSICGDKETIKEAFMEWIAEYSNVELYSDVCYFDMVLFISLFGGSFDLPDKIAPSCHDINQDIANFMDCAESLAFDTNREELAKQFGYEDNGVKHNSLHDALVIKAIYDGIKDYERNIEG